MRKVVTIILCGLLLVFTSCKVPEIKTDNQYVTLVPTQVVPTEVATVTPTIEPTITLTTTPTTTPATIQTNVPTKLPTSIPTIVPTDTGNEISEEALDDLSEFSSINKCFMEYDFKITHRPKDYMTGYFSVEGNYDLNHDESTEAINVMLSAEYRQSYVEVNQEKLEFYLDNPFSDNSECEVKIVDLDQNDDYLEIACYDEGPSADMIYHLFRYDGKKLYELGDIDANALINQQGKLISSFDLTRGFKPKFCSAWYEIENNTLVQKINSTDRYLGKTYEFVGAEAYFIESDSLPTTQDIRWESVKKLEAGKVKLIDLMYIYDRTLNYYYIEFPSGKKGLLYYYIGD